MPMTQTFTSKIDDVIRYLYNESNLVENEEIEKSLGDDFHLLDFYLDGLNLKKELSKVSMSPSERSINEILNFSKNYQPVI